MTYFALKLSQGYRPPKNLKKWRKSLSYLGDSQVTYIGSWNSSSQRSKICMSVGRYPWNNDTCLLWWGHL